MTRLKLFALTSYSQTTRDTNFMCRIRRITDMSRRLKFAFNRRQSRLVPFLDRILTAASRHNAAFLLFLVCCGVALIGAFVIRDLQAANDEALRTYSSIARGLQHIGELQYEAQETRRATLYALTTSDSNLQVEYADQSRNADQRVSLIHISEPTRRTPISYAV